MRILLFLLLALNASGEKPLPNAHAHNDYEHKRPLHDALAHGICSVEADIFLVDGKLLVGHYPWQLKPGRTLEKLYLDPLRKRAKENKGQIYGESKTGFTLLIDIKSDGADTYRALSKVLAKYENILTSTKDGVTKERAITVIISGNRAKEIIAADNPRYAGIDGRLDDLKSDLDHHLLPLISDNWNNHFKWKGEGKFPDAELKKLSDIVKQTHAAGRRLRFWATPEKIAIWRELKTAEVDLIGTDDLPALRQFLAKTSKK